jgi:Fic family protein
MKKDELHPHLQKKYNSTLQYGVEKGISSPFNNTWFVIPKRPPEQCPRIENLKVMAEANKILQTIPKLDTLTKIDRLVLGLFIKREALSSSRMEGTWSTIDHVFTPGEFFDKNEKSGRKSILGYANAVESVFDKASSNGISIITIKLIKDLHKKIMSEDPEFSGQAGLLRSEESPPLYVTIGGFPYIERSTYNPTPPQYVSEKISELLDWIKNDILIDMGNAGMGMGFITRMAIAHSHFEAIHPFRDGNGRVGRILMMLQMICEGYSPLYISNYIELKKSDYNKVLSQAQKKLNYAPIIHFFCEAFIACWEESQKTKKALLSLPIKWSQRGNFRKNSAADLFLEHLLTQPIFTVQAIMKTLKVSAPAANKAAELLVKKGIVRERTGFNRNRLFAAEEVISLLARSMIDPIENSLNQAQKLLY